MNPKKYTRLEPDGTHWPDGNVGDDLFYAIDFTDYLLSSTPDIGGGSLEVIQSVVWTLPTGVTSSDDFLQGDLAIIKLNTPNAGVFKIISALTTITSSKTQTVKIPMILTVY